MVTNPLYWVWIKTYNIIWLGGENLTSVHFNYQFITFFYIKESLIWRCKGPNEGTSEFFFMFTCIVNLHIFQWQRKPVFSQICLNWGQTTSQLKIHQISIWWKRIRPLFGRILNDGKKQKPSGWQNTFWRRDPILILITT